MKPEAYKALAERQLTYWWHRSRRGMALSLLRRYGLREDCRWLDVGCGPGGNLHMLDALHPKEIVGIDLSADALAVAAEVAPNAKLIRADINDRLPFDDASFDVVTIFNVLYHQWVKEESAVLSEVARVLSPQGLLLVTEPAFESLRRDFDDTVMTRRRYRLSGFTSLLKRARFDVCFGSYFTSLGAVVLAGTKSFQREDGPLEMRRISPIANAALSAYADIEGKLLLRGLRLPFGTTLVMVAHAQ